MDFILNPMDDDVELAKLLNEPSAEINEKVELAISQALARFEEHFGRRFNRPKVVYDVEGKTAGWAIGDHTIRLNLGLLYHPDYQEDMLKNTIPHEVAHIVQHVMFPDSKGHGGEWQYLMHILGLVANRTHSYETVPARKHKRPYVYRCNCQLHFMTRLLHERMLLGQLRYCKSCGACIEFVREEA